MSPICEPIRLPKITKYKDMVTTGGMMVCTQMRAKRSTSLITMALKAMYCS